MSSRAWLNGDLVDKLAARVSVYDHGLLYGDGVWEGLRLVAGTVYRLADHVALLTAAAESLFIPLPKIDLTAAVTAAVAANARRDGYVRVILTRGPGTLGLDPRKCDPQLAVLVDDVVPFPAELYGHGLHVVTARSVRLDPANPLHRVRSLSHGHMVLAKAEALRAGCLDAVLLTTAGTVAGCTEGHLFAVAGGTLRTPPAGGAFPPDVLRAVVLETAAGQAIAVEEADLFPADLLAADELFLAGTSGGVIAVGRVDGTDVRGGGEGPVTKAVRAAVALRGRETPVS